MLTPFLRRAAVTAAALAASALAACGDPFQITAQFDTSERTITFHALSGTPVALPAAVLISPTPQAVRPDPSFIFDLAFEFDETGAARLYPVDVMSAPGVSAGRRAGILLLPGQSYDALLRVPDGSYTFGESVAVAVGDVGIVQAINHPSCAGSFLSTTVFAKFRVEAIDAEARRMTLRMRVNPNCGFRGLETGLPTR